MTFEIFLLVKMICLYHERFAFVYINSPDVFNTKDLTAFSLLCIKCRHGKKGKCGSILLDFSYLRNGYNMFLVSVESSGSSISSKRKDAHIYINKIILCCEQEKKKENSQQPSPGCLQVRRLRCPEAKDFACATFCHL